MPIPPKPPNLILSSVTHHTAEVSWEPYYNKLSAALPQEEGRLKVELQMRRVHPVYQQLEKFKNSDNDRWDIVYKGFDTKCTITELTDEQTYELRYRFGTASGWGDYCENKQLKTMRRPFTGEDLHRAVRRHDEYQVTKILEAAGSAVANSVDEKGFTPLVQAAIADRRRLCEILMQYGADVNFHSDNGKTPLMQVASRGSQPSLELLLDNGADLHARDRKGMTPLHYAVDAERLDIIRLLLERGADPDASDACGCTPLIRCAMLKNNGNPDVAEALISAGALVERQDNLGQCALFYCVLQRHLRMAEVLLAKGASASTANNQGVTALSVAEAQDTGAMRLLLRKFLDQRSD